VSEEIQEGDIVALSEKALAVARRRTVDESKERPGVLARILAFYWSRIVWGLFLGKLCHLTKANVVRLRAYPVFEGAQHKQVCLENAGLFQALRPFSEGGIDTTNLPFSLVSLALESPKAVAEEVRRVISDRLKKTVSVVIVDSDKTYSRRGVHLASRAVEIRGIVNLGFLAYLIGRMFRWRARSTPLAWAGLQVSAEHALRVAGLANRARGHGAGKTAWEMADRFGVGLTQVSWEMIERVEHKPIVIVRYASRRCDRGAAQGLNPSSTKTEAEDAVRSAVVPGL
jgi:F420-0:gamma-glutamyl ligase-like protein